MELTHRATVKNFCMEQLKMLGLSKYYSESDFNTCYKKNNCTHSNAWIAGSNIADYILTQANSKILATEGEFFQLKRFYEASII